MKLIYNIALVFCVFLIACGNTSSENGSFAVATPVENDAPLPKSFYKKLKGNIGGNLLITMDLARQDSIVSGSYYYDKYGEPITITGRVSSDDEFTFFEVDKNYEQIGQFTGRFISREVFEGTWSSLKKKKSLPFNLKETKQGFAEISFEKFYKENCAAKEKNKQNNNKDEYGFYGDTLCSYIDINLVKVSANNPSVSKSINWSIVNSICGDANKKYNSINNYLNSIDEEGSEFFVSIEHDCSVVTNDNDILCISSWVSQYNGGAAHPVSDGVYLNFDIQTGQTIKLNQILKPNFSFRLNRIAEKKFMAEYGSGDFVWDFVPGQFKLNENFAITKTGLLFLFNQYEIGPYAAGAPEVFIPFREIEDLINPNGLLPNFRRK